MEFRKPTQADFDYVSAHAFEGAVKNYPYQQVPDDNTILCLYKDEIIGLGGLVVHWEGVAEAWLILTENFKADGFRGVVAFRAISRVMDKMIKDNNIRRVQATVRVDFPVGIKMVEFMGYQREGLLREYTPDKCDVYRYARLQ